MCFTPDTLMGMLLRLRVASAKRVGMAICFQGASARQAGMFLFFANYWTHLPCFVYVYVNVYRICQASGDAHLFFSCHICQAIGDGEFCVLFGIYRSIGDAE